MCSAIAATGVPALVMSKGHKVEEISEVPLVVEDKVESFTKTKEAVQLMRKLRAWSDVEKVCKSKRFRAGKGKMRNRRRIMRQGPCIVYNKDDGIRKSFRNIPGVTLLNVEKLNLLSLAPGGHVGRFCIWTSGALSKLDALYGTWAQPSALKTNYNLPQPTVTNSDLTKLMHSEEIQKSLRAKKQGSVHTGFKRNPLKNADEMARLNPFAIASKRAALALEVKNKKIKDEAAEQRKSGGGVVKRKKTAAGGAALKRRK